MKKLVKGLSVFLGLFMVFIGLNKFFEFTPIPSPIGDGGTLMSIYVSSSFLKMVGVIEFFSGIGLLVNRFKIISLIVLIAVMFNATIFHVLHDISGVLPALFCLSLSIVLIFSERSFTEILFRSR